MKFLTLLSREYLQLGKVCRCVCLNIGLHYDAQMNEILSATANGVLTLTLNRPEKQNAITRAMYQFLATQISSAAGDFGIRALVIGSEGKHFTAGNDIGDFLNDPPLEENSPVMQFLSAVHNFPKPIIAAVHGNAVGIGTTLLMHCDLVVAASDTNFSMPFVTLGLVPEFGSSYLFPKLVGHQRAAKVFLLGEPFDAKFALEVGLIAEISDTPNLIASRYATAISDQPPSAVIQTKALLKSGDHDAVTAVMRAEGELFKLALQSDEAQAAFMKFLANKTKK